MEDSLSNDDVRMTVQRLWKYPSNENQVSSNRFKLLVGLSIACNTAEVASFSVSPEKARQYTRADIAVGNYEKKGKEEMLNVKLALEAKAEHSWPKEELQNSLSKSWAKTARKSGNEMKLSVEQKPIVQLTTQMCGACCSNGVLFNGKLAYFCKLDKDGVLHATKPLDIESPNFIKVLLAFVMFAMAQPDLHHSIPQRSRLVQLGHKMTTLIALAMAKTSP
jgi:hypothetical protein